ncbi:uncharacterized protein LOC119680968 [Teleopsis dalmanni]|uniref:uncharacterized protein LOC119680968 n=1 Tax=Teleopsis dalmanni TaxID=139649 RepID=UPI0018CDF8DC|nr:uncharacterized protein LOC119680968 [Teleopsis dalmanni]
MLAARRLPRILNLFSKNSLKRPILECLRHASDSKKCAKVETVCEVECAKKKSRKKSKKSKKEEEKTESVWQHPNLECCVEKCPDMLPRFDELYFTESDKSKRKYFQTWVECPTPLKKPKVICNYERAKLPPMQKRKKSDCLDTARKQSDGCSTAGPEKCPRIRLCGCRGARIPPVCKTWPTPKNCKKRCAPFPSFSECMKDPFSKPRPVECNCLRKIALCELLKNRLRMQNIKK